MADKKPTADQALQAYMDPRGAGKSPPAPMSGQWVPGGGDKPPPPSSSKKDPGTKAAVPSTNDILNQGFALFASQYLTPFLQQTNAANNNLLANYGKYLNQAMANTSALPAGLRQSFGVENAQNQQLLQMLNNAQLNATANIPQFNSFMQQFGNQTAANQALLDMFTKMATNALYNMGGTAQFGQTMQSLFPQGSEASILSQLLASSGGNPLSGIGGGIYPLPGTTTTTTK